MIRTTATADTSGIDAFKQLLDDQPKIVAEVGQRVYNRHAPEALNELRKEPGAVKKPIQWTSERQRKFVMAARREKSITGDYERTHELSQGWTIRAITEGVTFRIIFENPSPAAKFVYGSMAQNKAAALRFKQKFHSNTGWLDAAETGAKWTKVMMDDFRQEYKLEVTVRRRAYTRGTKR
jgi:hypothetical protein